MNQQQSFIRIRASLAMNEQGLRLLRSLNYEKAIVCFHGGLKTLLDESQTQSPSLFETKYSWEWTELLRQKAAQDKASFGPATQTNFLFSASTSPTPLHDAYDEILTLFNRALSVRVEFLQESSEEVTQSLLLGVYFFNAGLAFHLKALSSNSSDSLSKAAEHYAIGYARFLDCSKYYGKEINVTLGLLAASNNVAHIHAFCRDMEQVEICIEELASKLSSFAVMQSGETQHVNDCRIFLQNVCYFQESVFSAAPAA